jgi:hypothetical protein
MPFAVVAVVIPEVLPPMGKKYFQATPPTTEQRKKTVPARETFPEYHRNHRTLSSLSL